MEAKDIRKSMEVKDMRKSLPEATTTQRGFQQQAKNLFKPKIKGLDEVHASIKSKRKRKVVQKHHAISVDEQGDDAFQEK